MGRERGWPLVLLVEKLFCGRFRSRGEMMDRRVCIRLVLPFWKEVGAFRALSSCILLHLNLVFPFIVYSGHDVDRPLFGARYYGEKNEVKVIPLNIFVCSFIF